MPSVSDLRAAWLARNILPHEPALRIWLRGRTARSLEIDDVIQETYAVLAGLESVDKIHNPKSYMFSVAHRIVLQHLRRARIVSIEAVAEIDRFNLPLQAPSPEQEAADWQELRTVARLIGSLPAKCRQAFMLRKVDGLSQREVAEAMGISGNTVAKHVGKGLHLLMDALGREASAVAPSDPAEDAEEVNDGSRRHIEER